jgi:hypothetical protein
MPSVSTPQSPTTLPAIGPSTAPEDPPVSLPSIFNPDAGDDDIAWLNIAENGDVQKVVDVCIEHWRSAGPEAQKKMFALFAIAGIFIRCVLSWPSFGHL